VKLLGGGRVSGTGCLFEQAPGPGEILLHTSATQIEQGQPVSGFRQTWLPSARSDRNNPACPFASDRRRVNENRVRCRLCCTPVKPRRLRCIWRDTISLLIAPAEID
jgi:hypothetical protein